MKIKNLITIILLSFILTSCEKDDFCLQETPKTPKLILRFYDFVNKDELKQVKYLSVWAEGKDTLKNYRSVTLDSIALPLNTLDSKTVYHLKMNAIDGSISSNIINTITIKYNTEDVFISRSCGFKTIFNEVVITSDNGWFLDFSPTSLNNITNEFKAHVKIHF